MKKSATPLAWLLIALLFSACGGNSAPTDPATTAVASTTQAPAPASTTVPPTIPPEPVPRVSREALLQDFDTMMELMEDSFPYFGIVQRRLGMDIRAMAHETRAMIEDYPTSLQHRAAEYGLALEAMPELDEHVFWSIVSHEFFAPFAGVTHASALDFNLYAMLRVYDAPEIETDGVSINGQVYANEASLEYYARQEALHDTLARADADQFRFLFRQEPPEDNALISVRLLKTEIIEEEEIAYLSVPSFATADFRSRYLTLNNFYREIEGYEHLIIDIRDNSGGALDYWRMLVMYALWPEGVDMPDMTLYALYNDSPLAFARAEITAKTKPRGAPYVTGSDTPLPLGQLLEGATLPNLNQDDLQALGCGIKLSTGLGIIERRHINTFGLTDIERHPFGGRIWLLVNENCYSSAALFAQHAKEMGFATLVGAAPGGAYGITAGTLIALPNTGMVVRWDVDYLTDSTGRALNEFPTTPHYENRPGLDALETALQLIAEGQS